MSRPERMIVAADKQDLAQKGADLFSQYAREHANLQGRFAVALSGGATPRPLYRRLCREPYLSAIPWRSIHVFWVDERMVPFDSPDSNYGAARKDFLGQAPIPSDQIHPMPVQGHPEKGAARYETELKDFFQDAHGDWLFDFMVLGIGRDGHTASLLPGQAALEESRAWVVNVKGGSPHVPRLTLTLPVINRSRRVVFMASGKEKAEVLKSLWEKRGKDLLPAGRVRPIDGELIWLVDRAAARKMGTLSGF